jgi:hypothetical protein
VELGRRKRRKRGKGRVSVEYNNDGNNDGNIDGTNRSNDGNN